MLNKLSAEAFENLVGQEVAVAQLPAPLRVEEVKRFAEHDMRISAPFSVTLSGPVDTACEQGVCQIEHPEHGPLELFMVPLGPREGRMRYEIIFN